MKLKVITAPAATPVTLAEAKSFYRVLGDDANADITRSIEAAAEHAEQITNRQLSIATYAGYLDGFCSSVKLPKPPLKSVDKVEYIDADGVTQPFTDFTVDDVSEPSVLYFNSTPSDVKTDGTNNVIVTFTSGYDKVPSAIQSWILIHGLTTYEDRNLDDKELNSTYIDHLLDSYRIIPV